MSESYNRWWHILLLKFTYAIYYVFKLLRTKLKRKNFLAFSLRQTYYNRIFPLNFIGHRSWYVGTKKRRRRVVCDSRKPSPRKQPLNASRGPLTDCSDWLDDWLTAVLPADTKARLCACLQISGLIYKVIHGERRPVSFFSPPLVVPRPCPARPTVLVRTYIPCPKPATRHVFRSLLDPGEPSGNLANTDVSDVYTRRTTHHSTSLHVALTFHPPANTPPPLHPSPFARILFRFLGEVSEPFRFAFVRNSWNRLKRAKPSRKIKIEIIQSFV